MKLHEIIDKKYLEPLKAYDKELKNWRNFPIKECNEELVSLKDIDEKILISPQYYINNIPGSENDCKIRKSLAEKIIEIAHKLPDGFYLLVWDSFRTIQTQQALFDSYYEEFKNTTNLQGEELMSYTCKFVSLPSLDNTKPSPHNTGAAIDLTICTSDGISIPVGSEFDDFSLRAYTNYYEEKLAKEGSLNEEETEFLINRRILCNLFTEAGFVNYPYEIWHKSLGDQMWSELLDKEYAIYSSVELK